MISPLWKIGLYLGVFEIVVLYFVLAYAEAHERSHWLVGRIWTNNISIYRKYGVVPTTVNYRSPYDLPQCGMRVAGIAPLLFCPIIGSLTFSFLDVGFLIRVVISGPFFLAGVPSLSDLLAFFFPIRFQEYAEITDIGDRREMRSILFQEIRSKLNLE